MLENIAIFIIFLCPLVFFHELGHFLFARLFGVRVETFSIGFGPKLFKKKWGDTEYAVSLIPLGGYVKMFGDDPFNKDEIAEEDRKFSFTHQGKWARFWIVFGGPLANFLMAYFIFYFLLLAGERIPELRFGVLPEDSVFHEKGLRTGDALRKVNGDIVYGPADIAQEGNELIKTITIKRGEEFKQLEVGLTGQKFFNEFSKYPPLLRQPKLVNEKGEILTLTTAGVVVKGAVLKSLDELAYPKDSTRPFYLSPDEETKTGEKKDATPLNLSYESRADFYKKLVDLGLYPMDLMVKSVNMKSPADEAGVLGGDIILAINQNPVYSFDELRNTLQNIDDVSVTLSVLRDGKRQDLSIKPEQKEIEGKVFKLIGVYSAASYLPMEFVHTESRGFFGSIPVAWSRTWEAVYKTADGFKKLITSEVSFKNIGGPIAIGKVASDSFKTSLSYFFQIMALISVNLGLINLFPIPVLDGGHIVFIVLELINRGPLSRRKMEIAQQFGLSLLLILTFAALFNDFSRFF